MDFVFSKPLVGRYMEEACVFATINCIFDFGTPTPESNFSFIVFWRSEMIIFLVQSSGLDKGLDSSNRSMSPMILLHRTSREGDEILEQAQ